MFYFQHKEPKRISIYGTVNNQKEDYTDGFEEEIDMKNTAFKFTSNGLEAVYNEAPTINGIEDKVVYIGDTVDALSGVTVTDDKDISENITLTARIKNTHVNSNNFENVESRTNNSSESTSLVLDTNSIKTYEVEYTATDSWGRQTVETRRISVMPRLYDNIFKVYSDLETSV